MQKDTRNYKNMRTKTGTLERLRKFKPYPEMSDDKLLNLLLDKLEGKAPESNQEVSL